MSVVTRLGRAARGDLARLIAVVAVFAGLALADGMQCSTMGPAVPAACMTGAAHDDGRAVTAMGHGLAQAGIGAAGSNASTAVVPGAVIGVVRPAPDPGGLLATCLALILAVVAMVVFGGPPRTWRAIREVAPNRCRVALANVVHPRASSLAELCLLRT